MVYASYSTGFKSGGTNTDRISTAFNTVFGAESSKSMEIGFKGDLGPVRLSAALYKTDYDDFQANTFTGTGFNLQNAGDVETQGFEIEALWRPFDSFEVQAFYARNEAEYASFPVGTCWDTTPFHTGVPDPAPPGQEPEQCDRSGNPVPYNPENRAFVAATKDFVIGNNNLFVRAEASYSSDRFTDGDLDPFTKQDALTIWNLRAGLDIDSWNSTLTVWGRNITDERFYTGSFDAPIQFGRMNSYPQEPATYGVTFAKRFD
jgi:outer membrane receptor protein involved in Fe transport